MIKRFRILAESTDRRIPEVREIVVFKVVAVTADGAPTPPPQEIHVVVTAVDSLWGPGYTRVEGYVQEEHDAHTVLSYYASGRTDDAYVGIVEVHLDET